MSWSDHKFFYTDYIEVPLPSGHRFPMMKYRMLHERLLSEKVLHSFQMNQAPLCSMDDLLLAHSPHYINGLFERTLSEKEMRPIGLTMSDELLRRSMAAVGGFMSASLSALETGYSALLAGGTHHAHSDRGEGYCIFNDFAVSAFGLLKKKKVENILIIDLDVHQGNGNSSILGERDDVYILSLHGEKNYPFRKVPSHKDVALPEGTGDEEYLSALEKALGEIDAPYDIIFYQAGVDPLKEDTLGTFSMTFEGLMKRDQMVFEFSRGKPLSMAIGGGYSNPIDLTVQAYVNTFKVAKELL